MTAVVPHPGTPTPLDVFDLDTVGYVEAEFLVQGAATSYAVDGERTADGRWRVSPAGDEPFVTRILVRRPADAARASGTVAVEWLNVSGGRDAAPDWSLLHRHLIRRGDTWVGVSAQKVGIDGGGRMPGANLKQADPVRYGMLVHPGDRWSYDIYSQAARAILDDPLVLDGATARQLLAIGHSQSAVYLTSYVNAVDPVAQVFDGFLVHGRGARGGGFDDSPLQLDGSGECVRDDARVPVLVLQSETDLIQLGSIRVDQDDHPNVRLWEIAGAAHADTYLLVANTHDDGTLTPERLAELLAPTRQLVIGETLTPVNAGPQQHYVANAAYEHLARWAAGGAAPATAPRLARDGDASGIALDELGIARGGLRTPWVDVPSTVLSGLGQSGEGFAFLLGTTRPLADGVLAARDPNGRDDYAAAFERCLDATIDAGFLLADDRDEMLGVAVASYPNA